MGFQPGPLYKEIFTRLLEASLNGKVGTKEEEIEFVKERFGEHLTV
jgi:tRNA nucleotidyltransferase (CCA-adding enzyme)